MEWINNEWQHYHEGKVLFVKAAHFCLKTKEILKWVKPRKYSNEYYLFENETNIKWHGTQILNDSVMATAHKVGVMSSLQGDHSVYGEALGICTQGSLWSMNMSIWDMRPL